MTGLDGSRTQKPLTKRIGEAANVLLCAPSMNEKSTNACLDLSTVSDPSTQNVLSVVYTGKIDPHLSAWKNRVGAVPHKFKFVSVGDQHRSVSPTMSDETPPNPSIETVTDPADFTRLGVVLSNTLQEWNNDANQTVMCFDSLTSLLQYAEFERAYKFLHVLSGQVASTNAIAHYHIDPGAHDEQTINALKTIFDAAVDVETDQVDVRTRF